MDRRQRGASLIEVMVATAIVGVLSMMTLVAVESTWGRLSLFAAETDLRMAIAETRFFSMLADNGAAMKFRLERGEWTYAIYVDGDGDGVRNDDIERGVDKLRKPPQPVRSGRAEIGLPPAPLTDPVNGGQLNDRAAIRFGTSTLCSFSRDGDFSSGSIVLTDGRRVTLIVLNGAMRRISAFHYDGSAWSQRDR